ncbi:hypothetical protein IIC38_10015 [candidate division KSB1 bacterium]|nr:hypothetical protein [candidate division KSB1 bacterium]
MKTKSKIPLFPLFILLLFANFELPAQLHSLQTKNLQLIYLGKTHEYIVSHLARCFENSLRFHRHLFKYTPSEKFTVFLQDFSDYHNAGATSVPRNFIKMDLAPANYVFETIPANERMNWTMSHELVHIVTTDQTSGSDKFFRSLFFGKVWPSEDNPASIFYSYLTSPRNLSPRWYHEGLAVFWETWMAGGLGRVLGAYDEMVFRSMVRDGSYIYDVVGLESEGTTIDFQVAANSYLYGTRFISYLAYQYGPERVLEWASRKKGSKAYFASQFKKVYGVGLNDEWTRWIKWEREWQQVNLDSIRLNPTTHFRPISKRALGSISRTFYDSSSRNLFAAVRYPGQVAHIAAIDIQTGAIDKICDVKGPALYYTSSLAYDRTEGLIFYTTDNNSWRDLNVVDIKTGKSKRLMQDVRTGDLTFNLVDKSIWGVRHYNGISTLVRIPHPYKEWNQIYSFPYGKDIFDIDISPDGSTVTAALVEITGKQKLIKMDAAKLMGGETTYEVLFDFENSLPANFVFSPDGRYLYGSSYYSGVSNIYRFDFEEEDMDILSNCESGFFRPVPVSEDSLIVMRYTGDGFVPVMIAIEPLENVSAINFLGNEIVKKHPIVKDWLLDPPSSINIDSLTTYHGKYNSFSNIGLTSAYPIVEGYKDFTAMGMHFNYSDLLGITGFEITSSYSSSQNLPNNERLHLGVKFHHFNWQFNATYNGADFYDLAGPTKTSRKGYSLGLQYNKNLLYDKPKTLDLSIGLTRYSGLERLPDFQNVTATFNKLLLGRASLDYSYVRKSLGAVDDEKGFKWQLISQGNYVNSEIFPRVHMNLDLGLPLPVGHSSIWFRSSIGHSFGNEDNPFANYFFGGFGNNWVDYLTEKRYREYYSFPGVGLNEFGGKNYAKFMMEWNLPPIRFRRVGFTSFYLRWARIALFSSAIRTNLDGVKAGDPPPQFGAQRSLLNLGGQLDFRIVMFSRLKSTFSIGYAAAFEKDQSLSDEFMISLKIL